MEKRLRAINEIKEIIERKSKYPAYSSGSVRLMAEWIVKEQIVKQIFAYSHPEMMKRVSDILIFLYKNEMLSKEILDLFWDSASGKHDSIVIETHRAVLEVAEHLKPEYLNHLYKKLKEVPISHYDEKFLKLVKEFMLIVFSQLSRTRSNVDNQGLEILLPLINDPPSANLCDLSIDYTLDLIKNSFQKGKIQSLLELIARKVAEEKAVAPHLKLLQSLMVKNVYFSHDEIFKSLETGSSKFVNLVIENFKKYMKKGVEDMTALIDNCYNHKQNIEIRLNVIGSILLCNQFSFAQFQELWNIFACSRSDESELFFSWLEEICNDKFPKNLVSEIFNNILCNIPEESCTASMYQCFKTQFLIVNTNEKSIEVKFGGFYTRLSEKLVGFSKLQELCIYSQIPEIFSNATALLVALNLRVHRSLLPYKSNLWLSFVDSILSTTHTQTTSSTSKKIQILQNFLEENYTLGTSSSNEVKHLWYKSSQDKDYKKISVNTSETIRSIKKRLESVYRKPWSSILLRFGNTVYDSSNDNSLVSSLPLISSFTVEIINHKVEEVGPKEFLSSCQKVQDFLFDVISDHDSQSAHDAWNLLTSLPINASLRQTLFDLSLPVQQLIDGRSLYKMLYCLLIVKELIQDNQWVERFNESKGFEYIIKLFREHDVCGFNDSTCMKYSTVMIFLIEECFKFSLVVDARFVNQVFDCLIMIAQYAQDPEDEKIVAVGNSARNIFSELCQNNAELICEALSSYDKLETFIQNNFILCNNFEYSNTVMNLFLEIIIKCDSLLPLISSKAFNLVPQASKSAKSQTFWSLLTQLVVESKNPESLAPGIKSILNHIKKDKGETSSKEKKIQLFGYLTVLRSSIKRNILKPRSKFINLLLQSFLFEISIEKNLPKCKNDETRKLAFEILKKSTKIRTKNITEIINYLAKFHENTQWRTRNIHDWNYSPGVEEKSITGFVGLKNIGNICYMNSTLQQLYNIPTFCEEILRTDSSEKEDSNLRSIQFIFSGLKNSAKQYMSPKRLCSTFKDWEGRPINVAEQMDADEFFNNLMDKLESEMKGSKNEHSIRNHFGGIQITECIGKESCKHKSERAEAFMTLPVQVKNKKSLIESLESFVEGEILEGDNAYECDYCQAKVTALRRVCIKHLPNILIIVLRRFEFDFDTMNRLKVNDYCEFPMEIDMEPYTQEGLERKEMMKEQKEFLNRKHSDDYYKFKLKGITIHAGTAEVGHYYSYIKNRKTEDWLMFNDVMVNEFDSEDIPTEAFGGVERWNSSYASSYIANTREKYKNAYLLFYERDKQYVYRNKDDETLDDLQIDLSSAAPVSFAEVAEENERYWRCKSIFSPEYLEFVSKLLQNPKAKVADFIFKFCCSAFLVIFIRAKDLSRSFDLLLHLEKSLNTSEDSKWLSQIICVPAVYKELIIDCPIEEKAKAIVELVICSFKTLNAKDLRTVFNNFLSLFKDVIYARNNGNYFKLLSALVGLDPQYAASLDVHVLVLKFLNSEKLEIDFTPDFPVDEKFLGYDIKDPVQYEKFIDEKCPIYVPTLLYSLSEFFTDDQAKLAFSFRVGKSIINVNHKTANKHSATFYHGLSSRIKEKSKDYLNWVLTYYKDNDADRARIYLRQLKVLIEKDENYESILNSFIDIARDSRVYIKITEVSFDFLFKLCQKYTKVKDWFISKQKDLKWIDHWINNTSFNQRAGYSTYKRSNITYYATIPTKSSSERSELYRRLIKNQANDALEFDSDDEFPQDSLKTGAKLEVYDQSILRWVKAYILLCSKTLFAVKLENSNEKIPKWYDVESELIAPDGAKLPKARI